MSEEITEKILPKWLSWKFFGPAVILSVATLLGYVLALLSDSHTESESTNITLIYLLAAVFNATSFGLAQGLITAVIGFAVCHFCFNPSAAVAFGLAPNELVKLFVFVFASVFAALISENSKHRLKRTHDHKLTIAAFSKLYEELLLNNDESKIIELLSEHLSKITDSRVYIFMPDENNVLSIHCPDDDCPKDYIKCAQRAYDSNKPTPPDKNRKFDAPFIYCMPMPSKSKDELLGVLCIEIIEWTSKTTNTKFIHSLADQAALALERAKLAQKLQQERSQKEREELRSVLLASVTHDLKTPLSAIIGSLSSLRHMDALNEEARKELVVTAHKEASRLDDFISNILNMTKFDFGITKPDKDWHSPAAAVRRVARRLEDRLQENTLDIRVPSPPLRFYFDVVMIEQVIQNLLDNAINYSTPLSTIAIDISRSECGEGILSVVNEGPAIPKSSQKQLFDKFYRSNKHTEVVAGVGLGLAICQAIMDIHGGAITVAEAHPDSENPGTVFTLTFPEAKVDS